MKRFLIAVISVLSLVSVIPAFAAESQQPPKAETNFETMKADYLTKIEKRLSSIEKQKACVQNAENQEALNACISPPNGISSEHKRNMSKRGGPMGAGGNMPPQAN